MEATLLYPAEDLGLADLLGHAPDNEAADSFEIAAADSLAAERYAQMLGYALDAGRCRREQLLGFLGQELTNCADCDICEGRVKQQPDGEMQILEFVSRNRRRFTLLQTVELLRSGKSYEVVHWGLASYNGFGSLAGWQEEEIEETLQTLR